MNSKKLLYVARPQTGGMSRHLESLTAYFSQKWDVVVAAPAELNPSGEWKKSEVKCLKVPLPGHVAPLRDMAVTLQLLRICRQERAGLVHAHGYKAAMVALPAARISGTPLLVTVHNSLLYPDKSILPAGCFYHVLRKLDALVTRYIAVSGALRQELENMGINPCKIVTIYNGIDVRRFNSGFAERPRRNTGPEEKEKRSYPANPPGLKVGTAGRLVFHKGFDLFISAAARVARHYPGVRFYIAGEGPERSKLERICEIMGIKDRIFFLGQVANMPAYFAGLDLFVQPSRSEGLSFSLLEAGAAGLPLIAAAVGGIPEIIHHGKTGILVPPDDVLALEKAISWLISQPQKREKLGSNAAMEISRRFGEKKMLEETEKVYEEIFQGFIRH